MRRELNKYYFNRQCRYNSYIFITLLLMCACHTFQALSAVTRIGVRRWSGRGFYWKIMNKSKQHLRQVVDLNDQEETEEETAHTLFVS